jgi:arsenate reductase
MRKIYYLSSCSTCKRIMKELDIAEKEFILQDIKTEKMSPDQLDELRKMSGSYEALFSRVAMKYRSMGLDKKQLTEKDYRHYILEEYTFLKRPVMIIGRHLFIGNSKSVIAAAKETLQ